jgi:hypothetical protein
MDAQQREKQKHKMESSHSPSITLLDLEPFSTRSCVWRLLRVGKDDDNDVVDGG